MSVRSRVAIGIALLILLVGGLLAWEYSAPVLEYRENRAFEAAKSTLASYLNGSDSLPHAACQLAGELLGWEKLSMRVSVARPRQSRRMIEPVLNPPGTDPENAKFVELMINASRWAYSTDLPPELTRPAIVQADSIIRVRGFQKIQCRAA